MAINIQAVHPANQENAANVVINYATGVWKGGPITGQNRDTFLECLTVWVTKQGYSLEFVNRACLLARTTISNMLKPLSK